MGVALLLPLVFLLAPAPAVAGRVGNARFVIGGGLAPSIAFNFAWLRTRAAVAGEAGVAVEEEDTVTDKAGTEETEEEEEATMLGL